MNIFSKKIWKFSTSPSIPTFLKWWYIDTAISLGFLRTWTIFAPFSICWFGNHRIGMCVLKILGEGKLCTKLKSGIASKKKHSIGSFEYSALCFSNMVTISHAQCVPKQEQKKTYVNDNLLRKTSPPGRGFEFTTSRTYMLQALSGHGSNHSTI